MQLATRLVLIASILGFSACGADETASAPCPVGQVQNPLTGVCALPSNEGPNNSNNGNNGNNGQNNGETNLNNGVPDLGADMVVRDMNAPDLGNLPDMPNEKDMSSPETTVRFVAIGDSGTGSAKQILVGQSMDTVCRALGGCDFGMLLGDNVYDSGVDSVNDARFDTMFTIPYGALQFPFYAVLGNHDLGGDGLGLDLDFNKANYQIDYSQVNPMWKMPAKHYQVTEGPVWLVGMNTTDVFFDQADAQKADVLAWLANAPANHWKVGFGHHPYISNGPHGNAGRYEGFPGIPVVSGKDVKDFMDDVICGKFDVYICGHDHSRQDLQATCGTEFIVSGAGAKTTELKGNNPVHFESDEEGFLLVEATEHRMELRFYSASGVLEHSRVLTR